MPPDSVSPSEAEGLKMSLLLCRRCASPRSRPRLWMKPTTAAGGRTTRPRTLSSPPSSSSAASSGWLASSSSRAASRRHRHCWKGEGGKGGFLLVL